MKKQSQNKANLLDAQMNVTSVLTKDYERNDIFAVPENKANSNPIKPNFSLTQIRQIASLKHPKSPLSSKPNVFFSLFS